MRIAIVSDIHGNRTALEAVLADLRQTSPDLILHGGDLADGGARPAEIVDYIRDLGWPGVVGNTDEMLFRPESLQQFANRSPHLHSLFTVIEEMAQATRAALGEERLAWLSKLPRTESYSSVTLVHGTAESAWNAPQPSASDAELEAKYASLGQPIVVYAHIHQAFVRSLSARTIVNTGSVSLSYDGDTRSSYLLLDDGRPTIRRIAYDVDRETEDLSSCGLPHADWLAHTLISGRPQMPKCIDQARNPASRS